MPVGQSDSGLSKGALFVTSTIGNTVGGVSKTVGGILGAGGRGLGETITGVTGSAGKPIGDGIASAATGIENGARDVARGVEKAGQGK
ncbi:MAG: hypothetical protein M1834_000435 [Cirrosporium novae-zelandiae]|nr:MAG: hypothetical protein M1834_000435 [Cirrosporium novae-zelandiae]